MGNIDISRTIVALNVFYLIFNLVENAGSYTIYFQNRERSIKYLVNHREFFSILVKKLLCTENLINDWIRNEETADQIYFY